MIDLIKCQVLTDKTSKLLQNNKYTFDLDKSLTKQDIRLLIEDVFDVDVVSVNTYICSGKKRRLGKYIGFKNTYKRAFITINSKQVIPFFSGL